MGFEMTEQPSIVDRADEVLSDDLRLLSAADSTDLRLLVVALAHAIEAQSPTPWHEMWMRPFDRLELVWGSS